MKYYVPLTLTFEASSPVLAELVRGLIARNADLIVSRINILDPKQATLVVGEVAPTVQSTGAHWLCRGCGVWDIRNGALCPKCGQTEASAG